jgi:hypothetical protein
MTEHLPILLFLIGCLAIVIYEWYKDKKLW